MSEPAAADAAALADVAACAAGALLRAARQQQGLHIVALAAAIKVPPAKLEALESGRFDELPDATFTRALAQSVCRVLKIDATAVLAGLPSAAAAGLERVDGGLNMPFRERPGLIGPADWHWLHQPVLWLVLLLLLGAAAFVLVPSKLAGSLTGLLPRAASAAADAATARSDQAAAPAPSPIAAPASAVGAPTLAEAATDSTAARADLPTGAARPTEVAAGAATAQRLGLRASAPSWVQVIDGDGRTRLERVLGAGEAVELDGALPFKLRIGNAHGVELRFHGQPVDLAPVTRGNIAQLELQ